ncbi:hypothetical protein pb186bvf_009374 [Paramecium bursaria]
MIPQFQENLFIGSPCTSKSLQFASSGVLISASGNRIIQFNLETNTINQIQQARFNIKNFEVSQHITTVDDQGNIVHNGTHIAGKGKPIKLLKHSPDGKMIAITRQSKVIIYDNEMVKIKVMSNKHMVTGMNWSPDSRFLLTWGEDNSIIMNAVFSLRKYVDSMLQAHKFKIVTSFFLDSIHVVSLDCMGKVCLWKWVDDYITENYQKYQKSQKAKNQHRLGIEDEIQEYSNEELQFMTEFEKNAHLGRFILEKRINIKDLNLLKNFATIKSANYHPNNLFIIGCQNGTMSVCRFDITQETFITQLQSFQITQTSIDSVAINQNGNWIAFGMRQTGQLIVWEWRSQSYILNQQALSYEITCATISPDLTSMAVGTLGGVVRIYDYSSKFCIAKFDDQHTTKVTQIKYCPNKNGVLVSASLDGTVRAYDTIRLKCFRVMKPEVPNQLYSLDIEPSGDLICTGGYDPYEIYVFSLQTGQLVEVIAGHEGPVISLKFINTTDSILLLSGSWDKTIRVHDLNARGSKSGSGGDLMLHSSEITAIAVRDKVASVATMKGEIVIWDIKDSQIIFTMDVSKDIQGGRITGEMVSAQKNQNTKFFNCLEYSKDGQYLLGGGNSKYMCLYDMKFRILIRKIVISNNMSLDGMKLKINFSTIDRENQQIEESDNDFKKDNLPGAKTFDVSKRSSKRVPVSVLQIEFSSSNRQFIVAHSEGISVFGPQQRKVEIFDPLMMDTSISVEEIQKAINQDNLSEALVLALKLNQKQITLQIFDSIPLDRIQLIVASIHEQLIIRLVEILILSFQQTRNVEKNLFWSKRILIEFSYLVKGPQQSIKFKAILQELLKQIKQDFIKIEIPLRKCINLLELMIIKLVNDE